MPLVPYWSSGEFCNIIEPSEPLMEVHPLLVIDQKSIKIDGVGYSDQVNDLIFLDSGYGCSRPGV